LRAIPKDSVLSVAHKTKLHHYLDLNYDTSMCSEEDGTKHMLSAFFPDVNKGRDVYYQGSRQMTSTSRRYYEIELGARIGPSPGFSEAFGYTEPLRRFIQREGFEPQANEIPNTMPCGCPAMTTPPTSASAIPTSRSTRASHQVSPSCRQQIPRARAGDVPLSGDTSCCGLPVLVP